MDSRYQRADRRLFFNQAHNQLLQLITEGGLILAVPMPVSLIRAGAGRSRPILLNGSPSR
jgi:O-antigen ligase